MNAEEQLRAARESYERARARMDQAELDRARAVLEARAAGMTTRAIADVLGVTQPRIIALSRWSTERGQAPDTRPDPSATGRGAPEPTPVGVLLARALEVSPAPEEVPAVELEPGVWGRPGPLPAAARPDPSATVCRRVGCREQVAPGLAYCLTHSRC